MRKILITGGIGTGKLVIANHLSKVYNLPIIDERGPGIKDNTADAIYIADAEIPTLYRQTVFNMVVCTQKYIQPAEYEPLTFMKVRDVKTPNYGTAGSAGIDFYVPEDFKTISIGSTVTIKIPSGIKARVPKGYVLRADDKSSISMMGLTVTAPVIDSDFQGEFSLCLYNRTKANIVIKPGMKILQMLLIPVKQHDVVEVFTEQDLYPEQTERGSKGFGNGTGKG